MALCGYPGVQFRCRDLECILNDRFCIVLYTNSTVMAGDVLSPLGFVVPVKFLSFIKTMNPRYSYGTRLTSMFTFSHPKDEERLKEYVKTQQHDCGYEIIPGLRPIFAKTSRSRPK